MTSSSINNASRAQPMQPEQSATPGGAKPAGPARVNPRDVGAMRDALAAARGKVDKQAGDKLGGDKQLGTAGKKQLAQAGGERARDTAALSAEAEPSAAAHLKSREEGADALAGWAGQGSAAAQPAAVANPAPPHVDAGAFAQMMADLWARDNGRGSKEVRVRFGNRSWPATGAVLVRNAAGTLDVALQVGDGGKAYGSALPELEDAMNSVGITVGSLSIEHDG